MERATSFELLLDKDESVRGKPHSKAVAFDSRVNYFSTKIASAVGMLKSTWSRLVNRWILRFIMQKTLLFPRAFLIFCAMILTILGSRNSPLAAQPSEEVKPAIFSKTKSASKDNYERNWPQWRGPNMDGVALHGSPPVEWSEGKNIAWKIEIPGKGASTPIIWNDLIFLQTAVPFGEKLEARQGQRDWQAEDRPIFQGLRYVPSEKQQRFVALAVNRKTGKTVWQNVLHAAQPHEGVHPTNTWASASPVTDGERVVFFFGSNGLYVLDMRGNLVWQKDLGSLVTRNGWGEGASPALYDGNIVVNWDHEEQSFIAAFNLETGEELWRQGRDEVTAWFTPLVVEHGGKKHVVTTGAKHVRGYDLETGEELWQGPGLTVNAIPSPVTSGRMLYLTSGYRGNALLAVLLEKARGSLEQSGAILWRYDHDTPYVASPLLYKNSLYFIKHFRGVLTSLDVKSGKPNYGPLRLGDLKMIYASPTAADGRVYLPGRGGKTLVFEHGKEFKILAVNELDDGFDASPAIVGDELYLRGQKFLYKIEESK